MFNKGYVNASRSVRSKNAIDSYEIPLSMINKSMIEAFLSEFKEDFEENDLKFLKKLSISKWKYVAEKRTFATSWHHTSSYFNRTDHYDLYKVAEKILDMKETLDEEYKTYKDATKKEKIDVKYGVIKVQVWGGSRKRPKLEGYEEVAGIISGDWLFYKNDHHIRGSLCKYKTKANKVEWVKEYNSYADLVKNHKEYKSTKNIFNEIIKEKKF